MKLLLANWILVWTTLFAFSQRQSDAFSVAPAKTSARQAESRLSFFYSVKQESTRQAESRLFPLFSSANKQESASSPQTTTDESSIHGTNGPFMNAGGKSTNEFTSTLSTTETEKTTTTPNIPPSSLVPSVKVPIPSSLLSLPRHSHVGVNDILVKTEATLKALHAHSKVVESTKLFTMSDDNTGPCHERVFANSYVDLGKVDTVGFDYDYTLVTYTEELLELIYDMALKRLVHDKQYPLEMLHSHLQFNPRFSIRGMYCTVLYCILIMCVCVCVCMLQYSH